MRTARGELKSLANAPRPATDQDKVSDLAYQGLIARYKKLKQERRELEGKLLALQWHTETQRAIEGKQALVERETAMEAKVAEQRSAEAAMESLRRVQALSIKAAASFTSAMDHLPSR